MNTLEETATPVATWLTRKSMLTGKTSTMLVPVSEEKLDAWYTAGHKSPLIQDAFPQLTGSQREFILNGITPKEWASAFGEEDQS